MGYSFVFNHMRLLPMVLCSLFFFSLAGCDGLDSDGDGQVDYCEDQYPPELVLRKAEAFQCDYQNNPDASRYCYTAAVFKDEKQVEMLLRDNFVVIDDCPATELDVEINKIGGTCKNTRFTVKPIQDTGCVAGPRGERNISHLNPLDGTAEDVTVYLDDAAPSITCGFNRASHVNRNNSVSVNGKTLYHRLGDSVGSRLKLNNAGFFYTVNVSISPKRDLCILHRPIFFVLTVAFIVCCANRTTVMKLMFRLVQHWRQTSCIKARLPRLLNTIMQTRLANSSSSTKITGNTDTLYTQTCCNI